ncbi:hypothetical protein [Novosphingobium colocasiae]|uniref:hypothetical protein n=1 Tax=Novosphingobium colocasiae TaxID=1256513 RepID=UPI0035B060F0
MTQARRSTGDDAMEELAGAIGTEGARQLARHFGGTTVSVPRTIGDHHPLRAVLGDTADVLARWCGGARLSIPKRPERQTRVRELRRAGALTIAGIALETGYSERHVYRLLSERDDRQMDLFGE